MSTAVTYSEHAPTTAAVVDRRRVLDYIEQHRVAGVAEIASMVMGGCSMSDPRTILESRLMQAHGIAFTMSDVAGDASDPETMRCA